MKKLKVLELFAGIGGFSLGLERTGGFETVAFCEIEDFPRRVLAKHWPGVPIYHDVTKLTGSILAADGITGINVITGGFPCQDISVAGKQAGIGEGTRSGLWSEIVRLIGELRPDFVIVENVANLLSGPSEKRGGWFSRILGDLAECGYDADWENIPASALGAPHRRERVWIVARPSIGRDLADPSEVRQQGQRQSIFCLCAAEKTDREATRTISGGIGQIWGSEPAVGRVANGVPNRVDRLAALGNAVVPQIPEMIGRAILASLQETTNRKETP